MQGTTRKSRGNRVAYVTIVLVITATIATTGGSSALEMTPIGTTQSVASGDMQAAEAAQPNRTLWSGELLVPFGCVRVIEEPPSVHAELVGSTFPVVARSPDGQTVYVAGTLHCARSETARNVVGWGVAAFDAQLGVQIWSVYDSLSSYVGAIDVSPDGSTLFVSGGGFGGAFLTVAYDTVLGQQVWRASYRPGSANYAFDQEVSPDGLRLYVTGEHRPHGSSSLPPEYATIAYNASTGERLWLTTYFEDGQATAKGLVLSPDGNQVFVTGRSVGTGSHLDFATVAYDAATGEQRWVARYNGPGNSVDMAVALALSNNGERLFVTGTSVGSGTGDDYATIAYDADDGRELWASRYSGPGSGSARDFAAAIAVAPNGQSIYVSGSSGGAGTASDFATVAYDATTGHQEWVGRYNGPANGKDTAIAVATSPSGSHVMVTGESQREDGSKVPTTVAYQADGNQVWVERHDDLLSTGSWAPENNPFKPSQTIVMNPAQSQFIVASDNKDLLVHGKTDVMITAFRLDAESPGPE